MERVQEEESSPICNDVPLCTL